MCCRKSKKYKNKLSFWRFDNWLYLGISGACIIFWWCTYFIKWFELDEIAVSLLSGILTAALIPLGLNYGKFIREEKQVKSICTSIIYLAVFLVNNFNAYLIKTNNPMIKNVDGLSSESTKLLAFDKFKEDYNLLDLVRKNLLQLIQMEYFNTTDSFVYAVERINLSIQKSLANNDHGQLCKELLIVIKTIGTINPSSQGKNYVEMFDEKIDESNEVLKNNLYNYTDDYIVASLENDLSEKKHRNEK